jgi:hypothetical protein
VWPIVEGVECEKRRVDMVWMDVVVWMAMVEVRRRRSILEFGVDRSSDANTGDAEGMKIRVSKWPSKLI